MAEADIDELEDFAEYVDFVEDVLENERLPKRYIRDAENPFEKYRDDDFRNRYRFLKDTVMHALLPLVEGPLAKVNNRGLPISPVIQLLVCLRFYATGNFQVSTFFQPNETVSGDLRGVSQSSVCGIIKRVSQLLAQQTPNFVKFPVEEALQRENITRFWQIARFPGVAACIDCSHIPVASPGGENAEVYRNRKGYFSLNIQVAVGPQMEILDIVVRHPGSTHDSVIFDRSALRVRFEQNQIRGILLGDNGYPCRPYLLTPVIHPETASENHYNAAHIRTRNIVERVFGIWKRRFPCLRRVLSTRLETSIAVICACAVLYNIAIQRDDNDMEDILINDNVPVINNNEHNELGLLFRREFINQHF